MSTLKKSLLSLWLAVSLVVVSSTTSTAGFAGFIDDDDNSITSHHASSSELKWQKVKLCSGWEFSYPVSLLPRYIPSYGTNGREYHSSDNHTILRLEQNTSHIEVSNLSPSDYKNTIDCHHIPDGIVNQEYKPQYCREMKDQVKIRDGDCFSIYSTGPFMDEKRENRFKSKYAPLLKRENFSMI